MYAPGVHLVRMKYRQLFICKALICAGWEGGRGDHFVSGGLNLTLKFVCHIIRCDIDSDTMPSMSDEVNALQT